MEFRDGGRSGDKASLKKEVKPRSFRTSSFKSHNHSLLLLDFFCRLLFAIIMIFFYAETTTP